MSSSIFMGQKPLQEAKVPLYDLGFTRCMGVFDFLRTYNSIPFHLKEHLERLEISCASIGIELPYSFREIEQLIQLCIENHPTTDLAIRLIVTGGINEHTLLPLKPELYTIASPLVPPSLEQQMHGIRLSFSTEQRAYPETKTLFYLPGIKGLITAKKERPTDEILFIDPELGVLEASTANFFLIDKGCLITPSQKILPGITRRIVLEIAQELNIPVEVRPISLEEALAAEGAFITSTTRELLKVHSIEGHLKSTPPVFNTLIKQFADYVKEHNELYTSGWTMMENPITSMNATHNQ